MEAILSLSYGKDSLACIEAIHQLGYPLTRIIHTEIWATDDIPADLPPMVEFKKRADAIIKARYGFDVEHLCAMDKDGSKQTYEGMFYRRKGEKSKHPGDIYAFPCIKKSWCVGMLKTCAIPRGDINYIGIAADEKERIDRHQKKKGMCLPLVDIGWTETDCYKWCEANDLLSPIYKTHTRGGCWFCHKQSLQQLRHLRKNYPNLWAMLLKWDDDATRMTRKTTFKPTTTVRQLDERFAREDRQMIFDFKEVLS